MFVFHLIIVSKPTLDSWSSLETQYIQRLQPWAKLKLHIVKQVPFHSIDERVKVLAEEGKAIRRILPKVAYVIACDEHGNEYASTDFATKLELWSEHHTKPIVYIIGGPLGLDPTLIKQADAQLALAKWTFSHDLAQIVLLEQLYRACTITAGKTYHY
ncbi:MAG: hypothetical protein ACD_43C00157G0001 [uncultured bacterium]|nr:MAG: hypothetical protein ACD_43C00157G0001 [uncultured bacterium]